MRKTVTAAAMAASLTIGGAAGAVLFVPSLSGAQTDPAPAEESTDQPGDGFLAETLAPLVDDGTISQAQADAVIEALHDARPEHGSFPRHFPFGTALLDVLGIDAADLRDALAEGQTIAEVAEAEDVPVDEVISALVAEAQEHLDEAVADGRLTQDQADEKVADLTEHITHLVNGEIEPRSGRGHHGHRSPLGSGDRPSDDTTGS